VEIRATPVIGIWTEVWNGAGVPDGQVSVPSAARSEDKVTVYTWLIDDEVIVSNWTFVKLPKLHWRLLKGERKGNSLTLITYPSKSTVFMSVPSQFVGQYWTKWSVDLEVR